jgi:hypothetical protein
VADENEQQQSVLGRVAEQVRANRDQQPSLSGELNAIGREAIKDIRNTVHEAFFGRPETPGEPGTPLNPTPQIVTNELGTLGNYDSMLDQYAARGSVHGNEKERGPDR